MTFEAADLKKINKKLVGEMQQLPCVVKDGEALEKIGGMPTKEAQAFALVEEKPFESGNKRTAFFLLYYHGDALSNRNVSNFLNENKAWMFLLSKSD